MTAASESGIGEGDGVSKNARTALVLGSIVALFFVGVIVRHWLFS
jgi:hypothetical protein